MSGFLNFNFNFNFSLNPLESRAFENREGVGRPAPSIVAVSRRFRRVNSFLFNIFTCNSNGMNILAGVASPYPVDSIFYGW